MIGIITGQAKAIRTSKVEKYKDILTIRPGFGRAQAFSSSLVILGLRLTR